MLTFKYKQISYPKFLIECHIGRYLLDNEQVHHIDENVENNKISNLEVKYKTDHLKLHSELNSLCDVDIYCVWCGKKFIVKGNKIKQRNRRTASGFCSKKCVGEYGAEIQNHRINEFDKINIQRIKKKDL